jgi:isoleucyl-tRNA synthetase
LLPLLADTIWPALTGPGPSSGDEGEGDGVLVHLAAWPSADALPDDPALVASMDAVRDVCSAAASIRKAERLRVRLPLSALTVAAPDAELLAPFIGLIADEVNVKRVELTTDVSAAAETQLVLVPRVLGPRVGGGVQALLAAVKQSRWSRDSDGRVVVEGRILEADEFELRLVPKEGAAAAPLPGGAGVVALDTVVTPELEAEGVVRDVVRLVNQVRRDESLRVSDRIRLLIDCDGHHDVAAALRAYDGFVRAETLADELVVLDQDHHHPDGSHRLELSDGRVVHIAVSQPAA